MVGAARDEGGAAGLVGKNRNSQREGWPLGKNKSERCVPRRVVGDSQPNLIALLDDFEVERVAAQESNIAAPEPAAVRPSRVPQAADSTNTILTFLTKS